MKNSVSVVQFHFGAPWVTFWEQIGFQFRSAWVRFPGCPPCIRPVNAAIGPLGSTAKVGAGEGTRARQRVMQLMENGLVAKFGFAPGSYPDTKWVQFPPGPPMIR